MVAGNSTHLGEVGIIQHQFGTRFAIRLTDREAAFPSAPLEFAHGRPVKRQIFDVAVDRVPLAVDFNLDPTMGDLVRNEPIGKAGEDALLYFLGNGREVKPCLKARSLAQGQKQDSLVVALTVTLLDRL